MNEPTTTTGEIELPVDPDVDGVRTARSNAQAIHLRPAYLGLVLVGGTLGTAAREAISLAFPPVNDLSYAILGINVVGAFLLGVLLDGLARRGPDHGTPRTLRLLLGTGVMGGFTTYSAFATDSAAMIGDGSVATGIGYALATVLVGAAATGAGIAVATTRNRRMAGVR